MNKDQVIYASGASIMNGAFAATALSDGGVINGISHTIVTMGATHGIVAGSQLYISNLDNTSAYLENKMRYVYATPAATTMTLAAREGYTAGTPTTGQIWAAGYVSDDSYDFLGFMLHLASADAGGAALTLTKDAKRGAAWDTLIYTKAAMTGVTDLIYFPDMTIPMNGGDVIKFSWSNAGGILWGLEIWVRPRV